MKTAFVLLIWGFAAGLGFRIILDYYASPDALPRPPLTGAARVIDGDTIVIGGTHIRLMAIDAPESAQTCLTALNIPWRCGATATAYMRFLVDGKDVHCQQHGLDRYGRTLARCAVDGTDLGEAMVRSGFAIDYVRYDGEGRYREAQAEAKMAKRGIWQGDFLAPEQWRHRR